MIDKTEIKIFTVPEYKKEEEYLRRMHKKGWKFAGITFPWFYHFEKCEPEDVVYQLDYNHDGTSSKGEYVKIFQDCGWDYLLDYMGYSYFRKPVREMKGEEEIFSDDSSKLDMAKRVFQGRMIPMLIIFFACICPQIVTQYNLHGSISRILSYLLIGLFALYFWMFSWFGLQYRKLYQSVNRRS